MREIEPLKKLEVPEPPRHHTSCLVCFTRYENFKEHIRSPEHKEKTYSAEFRQDYQTIDTIIEELRGDVHPMEVEETTAESLKTKVQEMQFS